MELLPNDPDLRVFNANLRDTRHGKLYRLAWLHLLHIQKQIAIGTAAHPGYDRERWRRTYIDASNECSKRLSVLEERFHWPP